MKRRVKLLFTWILICQIFVNQSFVSLGREIDISSPSVIVMEASTGTIVYESLADEIRTPASITKIMTLLLIFEQLEQGKISLSDEVVTSAYAKSMGGSQVFLEEGEIQTVDTLIKCIAVASGNDASVAMAEYIAGTEAAFVEMMNDKATQLSLENTHFEDCCGLSDSDNHYTSARDVAMMSRELTVNYPEIFEYTGIWMEDIVHETAAGSSVFTLSSTNKLLKLYNYTTGLKTGSTTKAKYCLAATASKNDIDLIAVVMAAPDGTTRFTDAITLLEYGYSVCDLYIDENNGILEPLEVSKGVEEILEIAYEESFRYLDIEGNDLSVIEKEIILPEEVEAPIKKGEKIGEVIYQLAGNQIGSIAIVASEDIEKAIYIDYLKKIGERFLL
ncbi:MAG: D-alanyl-D-alanine carboxypeptidase family protein [Eubacteriales bacterium]